LMLLTRAWRLKGNGSIFWSSARSGICNLPGGVVSFLKESFSS
jgi:hypothetical protein